MVVMLNSGPFEERKNKVVITEDEKTTKALSKLVRGASQILSEEDLSNWSAVRRTISIDPNPPVKVERIECLQREVYVARDDLLQGGTKQRAIVPFLLDMANEGAKEFVYASPPSGFAQVALASVCKQLGFSCVLFCVGRDDGGIPSANLHEFAVLAGSFGAVTYTVPCLRVAEAAATEYASARDGAMKLPLGFDAPEFRAHLEEALAEQWGHVLDAMGGEPSEVWLPIGSATLGTVFRSIVPDHIHLHCVDVHVLHANDERILHLCELPNVHHYDVPELFANQAEMQPVFPSNAYYDAKLWRFVSEKAAEKALWWNVAK